MKIKNVSVIGAGTMGNGIAHVFAQHGFQVNLIDVNAEQLKKAIATITKISTDRLAKVLLPKNRKTTHLRLFKLLLFYRKALQMQI